MHSQLHGAQTPAAYIKLTVNKANQGQQWRANYFFIVYAIKHNIYS